MPVRLMKFLFRLSVIAFLVGGVAIVLGQTASIVLGDAAQVAAVEEHVSPAMCIAASISGLLAFLLSYAKTEPAGKLADARTPSKVA